MIVLKATQAQYDALNGYKSANSIIMFAVDWNGNYIIGKRVLTDQSFEDIRDQLLLLEEITYVPPVEEE